jgi:hypothetical protein
VIRSINRSNGAVRLLYYNDQLAALTFRYFPQGERGNVDRARLASALNARGIIMTTQMMSKEVQQCVEACRECQKCCVALETSGGVDSKTIQTAKDCAEMCQMCSNFAIRDSQFSSDMRRLCAEICNNCAVACEKMSRSSIAKDCAAACRRCADACVNAGAPVYV